MWSILNKHAFEPLTHDIATLKFYNNFALQINPILA